MLVFGFSHLLIERFQRTTDTEVVTSVLVKKDVAPPEGSFGEAIDELLLLQG